MKSVNLSTASPYDVSRASDANLTSFRRVFQEFAPDPAPTDTALGEVTKLNRA